MSQTIHLSDDRYRLVETLASERGQTPEELLDTLVDAAWEQACARYDAAFRADPEWAEGAREALAEADADQVTTYPSTEAFLRHLGADEDQLECARGLDQEPVEPE